MCVCICTNISTLSLLKKRTWNKTLVFLSSLTVFLIGHLQLYLYLYPWILFQETWRWSWQYQDYGGYNWTPYPNDKDITNEPPVKGTSSCQYHQISRLTINLTIDDSQRTYRCVVQGTNNQGSSNAEYLLGLVAETGKLFQLDLKILLAVLCFSK